MSSISPSQLTESIAVSDQEPADATRLVVLGDIHTFKLVPPPWQLFSKSFLGQLNLWVNRRRRFKRQLMASVVERILSLKPELLMMSGDLTTTAMETEFRDVEKIIDRILTELPAVLIPGNHDRYTFRSHRRRTMEKFFGQFVPHDFPHTRPINPGWQLLAIDGAVPRWLSARGRIGTEQMKRVSELIDGIPYEQGIVMLCHYPFTAPQAYRRGWEHRLEDEEAWQQLLASKQRRIVYVHGHIHRPWVYQPLEQQWSHVVDLNAGAPCMVSKTYPLGQGFWEMLLPSDPTQPVCFRHHARQDAAEGEHWQVEVHADPVASSVSA